MPGEVCCISVYLYDCTWSSVGVIGRFLKKRYTKCERFCVYSTINATNIMSNNKAVLIYFSERNKAIHTATPQTKPHTSTPVPDLPAQSQSLAEALPRPCISRAAQCCDLDRSCIPHRTEEQVSSTHREQCDAAHDSPPRSTSRSPWLAGPSSGMGCMCTHPRRTSRGCSG